MRARLSALLTALSRLLAPPAADAESPEASDTPPRRSAVKSKYEIGAKGVSSFTLRVVLDHERDLGVWVQPSAYEAVQELEREYTRTLIEGLESRATALGKKRAELSPDDLRLFEPPLDEEYIGALSRLFSSCLVTWEDGLVAHEGEFVVPDHEIAGQTARDVWISYMCRHNADTVIRICMKAARRARQLEGNSEGPSGGIGGTEEAPRAAEAPESTASADPPTDGPTPPERSAGISEVPASPA